MTKLLLAPRRLIAAAFLAAMSMGALSAEAPAGGIPFKQDDGELGTLMIRMVVAMAAIAAVGAAAIYVLKRYGAGTGVRNVAGPGLRVVQSLRAGPRLSLYVVEFGGKRVLFAHAEHGIALLATDPVEPSVPPASSPET